jgi:hypothetical protein
MAVIYDEDNNALLDEAGNQILDEQGSGGGIVKNPTTWVPQPLGFGYVTNSGVAVPLTTQSGITLTTNLGVALTTWIISVTGKYPTTWQGTGA